MVEYKVGEWLGDVCVVWKSEGGDCILVEVHVYLLSLQ